MQGSGARLLLPSVCSEGMKPTTRGHQQGRSKTRLLTCEYQYFVPVALHPCLPHATGPTHLSNPLWPTRRAAITKLYHYSLMFPSSQPLPTSFPSFLELLPYPRFSRCVFTCSHKASLSDNRVTCAPLPLYPCPRCCSILSL